MQNNIEFNSFSEAREKDLNLREIKESIKRLSEAQRRELAHEINNQIIEELQDWMEVQRWDELNFLKALTLEWNTIKWTNQREANLIHPWDIIKVEWTNILKNGDIIWNVTGFSIENNSSSQETQTNSTESIQEETQEATDEQQDSSVQEDSNEQETNSDQVPDRETTEQTDTNDETSADSFDEALDWLSDAVWLNESTEEQNRLEVKAYSQDGEIYIIWEDWEPEVFTTSNMSENFRESIETIQESNKKISNFEMIISALNKSDNEKYGELQNEFNQKIQNLDISSSESIEQVIAWIDEKNNEITENEPINLENKYEVISFIRDIDSNIANELLVWELFELTEISEEELESFIQNPSNNAESIKNLVWEEKYRDIRENIREKKTEADNYFDEYRDQFIEQALENWLNAQEASDIVDNQYKKSIIDSFVGSYTKNQLLLAYVEWLEQTSNWHWYEGENKMLEMFSDIQWVGYFDASDSTLDSLAFWSKEWFFILGTQVIAIAAWAVTMWAGYVWVNAAVWWARWYRWVKALQTVSRAANAWNKFAQAWRFWAMSAVWGSAFNVWYQAAQWENPFTSTDWYMESILFTWAFRAVWALSNRLWWWIDTTKPLATQAVQLSRLTALDTVAFSSIWLWLEWVLLEPGEWNAELIMQAIIMSAAFRMAWAWAQRLRMRRNWEKVEIVEWATSTPVTFFRHNQTGKTYTRTLDWKYYNHNWRVVSNLKQENLTRVTTRQQSKSSSNRERASISREAINTPENNSKIFNNLRDKLKNIPEIRSEINKALERMPIVNYPYRAVRFPIHNGERVRWPLRKIWESIATPITTPRDAYINIKNWNYPQAVKNILFSSNDITWKWWIMKIWAYSTIPTITEWVIKFNETGEYPDMTSEEFVEEVWKDYLSYMYLWVINSIILENLWYFSEEEQTTE